MHDAIQRGVLERQTDISLAMANDLVERTDGRYEETLGDTWVAEYAEDPETGLWEVKVSRRDVIEWHEPGFASLEDARRAATDYYDQV